MLALACLPLAHCLFGKEIGSHLVKAPVDALLQAA